MESQESPRRVVLTCALIALGLTVLEQLLIAHLYLNLRDEGYLWYGVDAVRAGRVPLRDFQSYDPGRYYWCAAFTPLVGSGIVGVRWATGLFHALGLTLGLLAARRVVRRDVWLVPLGLVFVLWGFPRFKLFEPAIVLAGVWALVRALELPGPRRYATLGAVVGLAACFGRNHGLYLGLASLALIALDSWKRPVPGALRRRLLGLGLGTLAGYSPLLAMLALVPGFARGFLEALLSLFERGANLPQAFPWSPSALLAEHSTLDASSLWIGFWFPVVLVPIGLLLLWRTPGEELRERALLAACVLVGGVYVHHFSVRSDAPHLAQAIPAVLLLGLALAGLRGPRLVPAAVALLLTHALIVARGHHPELAHFDPTRPRAELSEFEVRGDVLDLKFAQARHLERVRALIDGVVPAEAPLFIGSTRPTFYPLFGRLAPTWWIYYLWPETAEAQRATIRELERKGVDWALVVEKPFVDDPAFEFRETNPLVWQHFEDAWQPHVDPLLVPPDYYLFRRR